MRPAYPLRNHHDQPAWLPCQARRWSCAFSSPFGCILTTFIILIEITAMRTRGSESLIVLPLLPIFLIGLLPMLLLSLLGPAGLIILGILVASAGLTDILDANSTFSEQIIVHGYAQRSGTQRATHGAAFGNALCIRHDRCRRRPCGRRHRRSGAVVRASFARLVSEFRSSRRAPAPGPVTNSSLAHPAKI